MRWNLWLIFVVTSCVFGRETLYIDLEANPKDNRKQAIVHFNELEGQLSLDNIPKYLQHVVKLLEEQSNAKLDVKQAMLHLQNAIKTMNIDDSFQQQLASLRVPSESASDSTESFCYNAILLFPFLKQ